MANGSLKEEELTGTQRATPLGVGGLSDSISDTQADLPAITPTSPAPLTALPQAPAPVAPPEDVLPPLIKPTAGKPPEPIQTIEEGPRDAFTVTTGLPGEVPTIEEGPRPVVPTIGEGPKEVTEKELFIGVDPNTGEQKTFDTKEKADQSKIKAASKEAEIKAKEDIEGKVEDLNTQFLSFLKDILDPTTTDPIKEAEFNYAVSTLGPINQAQTNAMILQLKQQGIEGQGSGNALLQSLATQQGAQISDVIGKLNVESAKRVEEWNRYGPELANQVLNNTMKYTVDKYNFGQQQISDLAIRGETDPGAYQSIANQYGVTLSDESAANLAELAQTGSELDKLSVQRELMANYQDIEKGFRDNVPGLETDGSAFLALSPEAQQDYRTRVSEINKALAENDIPLAQQMINELKGLYPNATVGDYSNWNPRDFNTLLDNQEREAFLLQANTLLQANDRAGAADILLNNVIDTGNINENFNSIWDTMTEEKRAKTLADAGLEDIPVTSDEMADFLVQDRLNGMNPTTVDSLYDSYLENAPQNVKEWLLQPENADFTRAWIFDTVTGGNFEIDENGLLVPGTGASLPPWNVDSKNSQFFSDWPMATSVDENGELIIDYDGYNAITPENGMVNDPDYINYKSQLDKSWESYVKGGGELTRQEWYNESKPVWDGTNLEFKDTPTDKRVTDIDLPGRVEALPSLSDADFLKEIQDNEVRKLLISQGELQSLNTVSNIDTLDEAAREAILASSSRGYFSIGDSLLKLTNVSDISEADVLSGGIGGALASIQEKNVNAKVVLPDGTEQTVTILRRTDSDEVDVFIYGDNARQVTFDEFKQLLASGDL